MDQLTTKSLLVLGRQPELGIAELDSLYGASHLRVLGGCVLLDLPPAEVDFDRLGGSLKLAEPLESMQAEWSEIEKWLEARISSQVSGGSKFTVGLSLYGIDIEPEHINRSLLKIKKSVRQATGKAIRIVPNKEKVLSSAQVIHNKLTGPNAREYVVAASGHKVVIAQTLQEQDIEAYGKRDQARPKRDATVGMLPPKLAQIIINLASPRAASTILDPFCGSGVILQEALLMGYDVVGTDISQKMVDYAQENIDWLRAMRPPIGGRSQIALGDATNFTWPSDTQAVAAEVYLGRPLADLPAAPVLHEIINDVNTIITKFLKNIHGQIESGTVLSLALPAWRNAKNFIELPLIEHLTDMGYTIREFTHAPGKLIYWREGQVVGRRLLVINKI